MEEKIDILSWLYEYAESKGNYKIDKQIKSLGKDKTTSYCIKQKEIEDNLNEFFEKIPKNIHHLNFGTNYFCKQFQHELLKYVSEKYSQVIHLDSLYFEGKFMNLQSSNSNTITALLKTIHPSLKNLDIDLKGNYLTIEGISNIMVGIFETFPQLQKAEILISLNSAYKNESLQSGQQGLYALLNHENIQEINIDLDHNQQIDRLFDSLKDYKSINQNLNKLQLSLRHSEISLNLLSPIFEICPKLETLEIDMSEANIHQENPFFYSLSKSNLKNVKVIFYKSIYSKYAQGIFDQLFLCQSLERMEINFRYTCQQGYIFQQCFDNLNKAQKLQYLVVNLQNNAIALEEINYFAKSIISERIREFHLNILNDYHVVKTHKKYILPLEQAILSLPNIKCASLQFTSTTLTIDSSELLWNFSKDMDRLICQYVSFSKYIQEFMVFNPIFIFGDLYY